MKKVALLALVLVVGCKMTPGKNSDPVEISGKVTLPGGRVVNDVTLNLQPTGDGAQATLPVKDGNFKGTVTPGKYTYFLSEGKNPAAFEAIPGKYKAGSMDRQVEIASGTTLNLTLE